MYSRMKDLEQNIAEIVRACALKEMLRDEEAQIRAQRTSARRIRRIGWSAASITAIAALALLLQVSIMGSGRLYKEIDVLDLVH